MAPTLFSPVRVGPYELPNRIVMAPMTRNRAGPGNAPTAMNATYYAQRAGAGLIVTEGSQISPQGLGYPGTPGIHSAGAGRRLAAGHRSRARQRRPYLPAALACRAHLASEPCSRAARCRSPRRRSGRRASCGPAPAWCRSRRRGRLRRRKSRALIEDLSAGRRQCPRSRLRRRRNSRRQRLPDRPVPARQAPTGAPTATAARSRTAPGSRLR